jgi:RNA 3'-terminal phosphate cyclase (ATP)
MTGRPLEIFNIRGRRQKPGLQPQHLASVRAAAQICGASLRGAAEQSLQLIFEPSGPVQAGEYRFDIGTAGSASLVVQTVLMPLALAAAASKVTVTGGTYNPMAPTADYLEQVFLPTVQSLGLQALIEIPQAGYVPLGQGRIETGIEPSQIRHENLQLMRRGQVLSVEGWVVTSNLPETVAVRGAEALRSALPNLPLRLRLIERPAAQPGAAITLVARCEQGIGGFSGLGARGKPMERVAQEAAEQFLTWLESEAAVDEHMADQLVLPAAVAVADHGGTAAWTTSEATEHLRTVLWLVEQFLPVRGQIEPTPEGWLVAISGKT